MATRALRTCIRNRAQTAADDQAFFEQGGFQGGDGPLDQLGAVVDRLDLRALGQARSDLGEPRLDVLDHRERVLAIALDGDAADRLALAVQLGRAAALVGRQFHPRHVAQQHRSAALGLEHDALDVLDAAQIAAPAHHVFGLGQFDHPPANVPVGVADRLAQPRQRNVEGLEAARIDHHAVLADEAADAGDLGHAFGLGQGEADLPVLGRAQLRQLAAWRPSPRIDRPSRARWRRGRGWA